MFVYYKKDVKGEHARGIIRRLQRSQIFILLVNKCFVFFENDEHKIWQSCQTFPFCDRTVCTSKILDIWIELTVYLRKKYLYVHPYLFTTLSRWVVALGPLLSYEVGAVTVALLENTFIHILSEFYRWKFLSSLIFKRFFCLVVFLVVGFF